LRRYCIFSGGVFYFEPPCTSHAMLHWAIVKLIVIILVVCVLIFSLQTQAAPYITWTVCYSSDRYNAPPAPCAEKRWAAIQSSLLPIQKSGLVISEADLHFYCNRSHNGSKKCMKFESFLSCMYFVALSHRTNMSEVVLRSSFSAIKYFTQPGWQFVCSVSAGISGVMDMQGVLWGILQTFRPPWCWSGMITSDKFPPQMSA